MPISAGDKLGPYQILAPIGKGGMGEVWKARDTRLNRIVAIKCLKTAHSARFEQEARAIAALNHPHICQIFDIGPDYLVLEYIEGKPPRGPMALADALRIAAQMAGALEAAHAKGILHRDLKPGNILVGGNGAKLLDFGLAKMTADEDATETMAVSGTPLYMSPEQAEGATLDARADIFSFGAVLYEMVAGQRAFATLGAVLRDEPAQLDSPAAEIVKRCLAKRPAERFQTIAEVRAALEKLAAKPIEHQPSIAVLPFANMSSDKEQEYFSDGLAEEILNLLAKMPGVKVIARTSSFAFRGKEQDIRKIAETLDVTSILEGSVRRSGNRIRVTAQLIDASDGSHLWSERYDRQLTDVFEVQDEIAAAIARALQLKLAPKPATATHHQPSLPAYEAYLKGRHHCAKTTLESYARATECFEQAIALDPKFALACGELATVFAFLARYGIQPPAEAVPKARIWAQKALELDPLLSVAHAVLGFVACCWNYDWREGERRFEATFSQDSVSPQARSFYGYCLLAMGRVEEGEQQYKQAVEEDPLYHQYRVYRSVLLWTLGKERDALQEIQNVLDLDPGHPSAHKMLGVIHVSHGEFAEALGHVQRGHSSLPTPEAAGLLAALLALTGDARAAEEALTKLGPPETFGTPRSHMVFNYATGNVERALDWFEKMIDQRDHFSVVCWRLPFYKPLVSSPRWPALARRMNLPESAW